MDRERKKSGKEGLKILEKNKMRKKDKILHSHYWRRRIDVSVTSLFFYREKLHACRPALLGWGSNPRPALPSRTK